MKKSIIFDLDGTLWDSTGCVCAIWNRVLNKYEDILDTIKNNKRLHDIWDKYSKDYDYVKDISFEMTYEAISSILSNIYSGVLV